MSLFDTLTKTLNARPPVGSGDDWTARCPACDRAAYLHLLPTPGTLTHKGSATVYCVSGHCGPDVLREALNLPADKYRSEEWPDALEIPYDGVETSASGSKFSRRILSRSSLATLPAPEPLIEETIDRRTVALLAGYHGTMKSFVALAWGAAIATGTRWQDRDVQKGRVLYIVGEGAYGINDRLAAWEEHAGVRIPDDAFHVYPAAVQLAKAAEVEELVAYVAEEDYDLVIIDTLARSAVGVDENSAKDMGVVIDGVEQIKRAMSAGTVLLVHHTGKDKATVRGSSALEAAVDTAYTTDGTGEGLKLKRTKRKDGPLADEHQFRLVEVGESAVLESTAAMSKGEADEHTRAAVAAAWETLRLTFGDTTFSRSDAATVLLESGMPRSSAYKRISTLASWDVLRNIGTEKTPRYICDPLAADVEGLPSVEKFRLTAKHGPDVE